VAKASNESNINVKSMAKENVGERSDIGSVAKKKIK